LFFASGEGKNSLAITGVVYNEMKGVYSSPDALAEFWSLKAVLPDTPYAFESGGDPDHIPDLTWEGLREFHRTWYSPANCRIFLAGDIPTEKQLAFLDEKFLSVLPPGRAAAPIPLAAGWTGPQVIRVPCPAGEDRKSTVLVSWLCSDSTNKDETMALAVLTEILLGHDGSPLTRALVESGLGEDLAPSTGLETELREMVFVAGLRGVDPRGARTDRAGKVEALILDTCRRLVSEGIPREEIEAALLSMEFSNREIRRSQGPYSLVWLRKSLRSWLYGGKPWDNILFLSRFTDLKARLAADPRYFESLIQRFFLDNPHRALVVVEPEEGYLEKKEADLAAALSRREAGLSEAERRIIEEKAAGLERLQSEADRPESLARIPHLSRRDLSGEIETVPREFRDAAGVPVLIHDLFTNGITYGEFAFPLDVFAPEDYFWLPLFCRAVVSVGLPGMDYGEVSSLLARTTGDFYAGLQTGSPLPGTGRAAVTPSGIIDLKGRDWIIFKLKALDEKIGPALDLACRLITGADFSDQRRIRDLVVEMKNDMDSSLAPSGHSYAAGHSGRRASRARAVDEIWNGLTQIEFTHRIAAYDTPRISGKLSAIRDTLGKAGLIVNLTAQPEALTKALRGLEAGFGSFGPPRPRNPASEGAEPFFALLDGEGATPEQPEVYASPSLQIGFASLTLPGASFVSADHAAELVLAHWLSTGALWEDIRMKGGAYGAFAHPNGFEGIISFSTYRDPNPLRSLEAFPAILKAAAGKKTDEESLVKAVIGTYAQETLPRTSAGKGYADFLRFLYGIEDKHRAAKLKTLIALPADELAAAAGRLVSREETSFSSPVVVAGPGAAEKAAARLGVPVKELPV
ncbi:MAG: insulinase family protein, partial [Spirochaetaceae bacterium]|nr:insulinase family protein [Spirochaetaceae bacterium]